MFINDKLYKIQLLNRINLFNGIIIKLKSIQYKRVTLIKIELYKDNWGRVEILFFYNKGDDALVDEEINRTWGMLKFKS